MKIKYNHDRHALVHTIAGPQAAMAHLFPQGPPPSLLDVGCGSGLWLAAAIEGGVRDVVGIDGVNIPRDKLVFPVDRFQQHDLTTQIDLGRRFAAAICMEVGEHIDIGHAPTLIDTLTRHADLIYFSGACPGQIGQYHVNCKWPAWWQGLFNQRGFLCDDEVRWKIWDEPRLEPWYRQNIFVARRDPGRAGSEPRIKSVIHPEMLTRLNQLCAQIDQGYMPLRWYVFTLPKAVCAKLGRKLFRRWRK